MWVLEGEPPRWWSDPARTPPRPTDSASRRHEFDLSVSKDLRGRHLARRVGKLPAGEPVTGVCVERPAQSRGYVCSITRPSPGASISGHVYRVGVLLERRQFGIENQSCMRIDEPN